MKNHGFVRAAAASPNLRVADCTYNLEEIIRLVEEAHEQEAQVILFPELSITGYTCGDLFFQQALLDAALASLEELVEHSTTHPMVVVVGLPLMIKDAIYNCAAIVANGKIIGITPKTFLPNYGEFYEQRWFTSSTHLSMDEIDILGEKVPIGTRLLYRHEHESHFTFVIEICEDLWAPIPPSSFGTLAGAALILNPSASNDLVGKSEYRRSLAGNQSARTISGYLYASAGYGESTTDVVYGGHCMAFENGTLLGENTRYSLEPSLVISDIDIGRLQADRRRMTTFFAPGMSSITRNFKSVQFDTHIGTLSEIKRTVDPHPFVPSERHKRNMRCEEIFAIQTHGLAKRIAHINSEKVVIGISGGLDSTLALLVCAKTFDLLGRDRKDIIAITMPGFGTTDRTYDNACELTKNLGCTLVEIPIKDACNQHFKDIGHDPEVHDVTYENTQARERTQILMNYSNMVKGIVIGTGDLSELALGWATYNGDHMSMYAVNSSVPKTLVRYLVEWVAHTSVSLKVNQILVDVLSTPVSPELLPPDEHGKIKQKTEEVVGPYELHDFFLYYMVRFGFTPGKILELAMLAFDGKYDREEILKWLRTFMWRFFSQQFKRSCMPDGPKVGSINLSPRGDWRMPSDAQAKVWLAELEELEEPS